MPSFSRREFIKLCFASLPAVYFTGSRPQSTITTITLPKLSELDDPLLVRIVDLTHPLEETEISQTIEPNLQSIPLTMDGILAANENVRVHSLCLSALEDLFAASNASQTGLYLHSGFRTYEQQAIAFSQAKDKSTVLKPGTSQHHTGLALDFTSSEIGKVIDINSGFERTKAGIWLETNAIEYGFVRSYASNHDGIRNESWHYLFIGKPLAKIFQSLKAAGWYGDVFLLQQAVNLHMSQIVFDQFP